MSYRPEYPTSPEEDCDSRCATRKSQLWSTSGTSAVSNLLGEHADKPPAQNDSLHGSNVAAKARRQHCNIRRKLLAASLAADLSLPPREAWKNLDSCSVIMCVGVPWSSFSHNLAYDLPRSISLIAKRRAPFGLAKSRIQCRKKTGFRPINVSLEATTSMGVANLWLLGIATALAMWHKRTLDCHKGLEHGRCRAGKHVVGWQRSTARSWPQVRQPVLEAKA